MKRNRLFTVAVACSLFAVVACGSTTEQNIKSDAQPQVQPPDETHEPSTQLPSTEPGFALRTDDLDYHDDFSLIRRSDGLLLGPHTVAVDSQAAGQEFTVFGNASPTPGVAHPTRTDESEITQSAGAVQLDSDRAAGLAIVVQEHRKSQGLDSNTLTTRIEVFDDSGSSLEQHVVEDSIPEVERFYAGFWGDHVLVSYGDEFSDQVTVFSFNLQTSTIDWKQNCDNEVGEFVEPVVGGEGTVVMICKKKTIAMDIATGNEKWRAPMGTVFTTGAPQVVALDPEDPDDLFSPDTYEFRSIDSGDVYATGPSDATVYDSKTGLLTINNQAYNDSDEPLEVPALQVIRAEDGDVIYERTASEMRDFGGMAMLGAFDGRLWIWSDDGPDVVELTSGDQDDLAPSKPEGFQHTRNVPLASGQTWVIIGTTNGSGDASEGQILRSSDGGFGAEDLPATEVVGLG